MDFLGAWRVFRKYWIWIAVLAVITMTVTLAVVIRMPPIYASTARILIPRRTGGLGGLAALPQGAASGLAALGTSTFAALTTDADTYMAIVESRTVAEDVIGKLNLQQRWGIPDIEDAVRALGSVRSTYLTKQGTIVVTVENADARLAADIANAFADALDKVNREFGITDAGRNRRFLETRLADTKQSLREAEDSLRRFQERSKLVVAEKQGESIIQTHAKLQEDLRMREAALAGMRAYATDQNPDVVQEGRKIQELKRQLSQFEYGQGIDLPSETQNPNQRRQDLHLPAVEVPQVSMELAGLQREVKIQETLFAVLTAQLEQARIAEARDLPTLQILDRAVPSSKKVRPLVKQSVLFAGMLSLVAGFFLALIVEQFRARRLPGRTS